MISLLWPITAAVDVKKTITAAVDVQKTIRKRSRPP
jgi:hypothetical protein